MSNCEATEWIPSSGTRLSLTLKSLGDRGLEGLFSNRARIQWAQVAPDLECPLKGY